MNWPTVSDRHPQITQISQMTNNKQSRHLIHAFELLSVKSVKSVESVDALSFLTTAACVYDGVCLANELRGPGFWSLIAFCIARSTKHLGDRAVGPLCVE
jgi:hypothetical protein